MQPSYGNLDPSTARTYRVLSLHTGPDFTLDAAAALLDTDASAAEELIADLAQEGRLAQTAPGRWHFPGLTGQHARDMASTHDAPEERAAAIARGIDHHLRASAAADLIVNPGRLRIAAAFGLPALNRPAHTSPAAALAWCDTEHTNLLHAQQTAPSQGLDTLAWQFADTLWGWCTHRHNYLAWESVCQTAIESAHTCEDARAEVLATVRLASCRLACGDVPAAATLIAQALQTARASGDRAGEGSAREHAAMCALATGNYSDAIDQCTRGLACWRHITSHRRPEALLERLLGRAYAGLGDHQQATAHLNTALAIFTELNEHYHTARTLYVIATTHLANSPGTRDIEEATILLEQARPMMQGEDHPFSQADLLTALADAHTRAADTGQASACLQEATALQLQLSLPEDHPARIRTSAIATQLATATSKQPPHGTVPDDQDA